MEARRLFRAAVLPGMVLFLAVVPSWGAAHRSPNFVVSASTPELAREIATEAERVRRKLAIEWLGKEMPSWSQPCQVTARVSPDKGAGGATTFAFDRGEVFGWRMTLQGSRERILDSVLPHEVTHTILACHFRRPVPRWADEGACTTVEHRSERAKQDRMLRTFLATRRGIPFSQMFAMKEYPPDVGPLYAQGYSLARYLIGLGGKSRFLEFLADGMEDEHWPRAIRRHYGHAGLLALQNQWLGWVRQGSPHMRSPEIQLASADRGNSPVVRGQSPDIKPKPAGRLVPVPQRRRPAARPAARPRSGQVREPVFRTAKELRAVDGPQPDSSREPARPVANRAPTTADDSEHGSGRSSPHPAGGHPDRRVLLEWSRE